MTLIAEHRHDDIYDEGECASKEEVMIAYSVINEVHLVFIMRFLFEPEATWCTIQTCLDLRANGATWEELSPCCFSECAMLLSTKISAIIILDGHSGASRAKIDWSVSRFTLTVRG